MINLADMGWLIDGVIAFTLIEGVALAAYHRATGCGVAPRAFAVNMLSGLCLMFALRCAVHDAARDPISDTGAALIAVFLGAAGIAHGTDILRRWQRRAGAASAARIAKARP